MGTYTITDILKNTKLRFKKIITISNNYHDILRNKMNDLNYKVGSELIIKENKKYYNLIVFTEGTRKYSNNELLLGLNHIDNDMYNEYLNYLLNKYNKILEKSNNKNDKINTIVELIRNKKIEK